MGVVPRSGWPVTLAAVLALGGLAVASFVAATPLPFTSEPLFVGMLVSGMGLPVLVVVVASIANAAGSVATFALARAAGAAGGGKWLPISSRWRQRLEGWYARWGLLSLLLSWIPGGDLLVVLAGFARAPVAAVVVILTVAKSVRFAGLALITLGLFG